MCGRFTASFEFREIKVRWNLQRDLPIFTPRYNIAPSQEVPVVFCNEERNEVKPMRWGLVPSWAPDPSIGQRMINARAESLLEKPSFKQLVSQRRCLVPADGFYEWRREGKRRCRCGFNSRTGNRSPSRGSGIIGETPAGDKELYSFTIITTQPNAFCGRFITVCQSFTTEHGGQWLEHSFGGRSMTLTAMLQPLPSADGSSRRFDAG
jgi:putative SOS response-associated peptidase YedK